MASIIMAAPSADTGILPGEVEARPVHSMEKQHRIALVREHHCLPWHRLFGKALHHAAVHDGRWLVLIGWQVSAFKVDVRDRWTGWSLEQQLSRLHPVVGNARQA